MMKNFGLYVLILGVLHLAIGLVGLMGWWDAVLVMTDILAIILLVVGGLLVVLGIFSMIRGNKKVAVATQKICPEGFMDINGNCEPL